MMVVKSAEPPISELAVSQATATALITSFGTPAESLILQYVPRFQMPYVFVR